MFDSRSLTFPCSLFNPLSIHYLTPENVENEKISEECYKILKRIPKMNLKRGQRRPLKSKATRGKWFLYKQKNDYTSLLLSFEGADETIIERFLYKTENTTKECLSLMPDVEAFYQKLDTKIKNYGIHSLKNNTSLDGISKIEFSESLFKEGKSFGFDSKSKISPTLPRLEEENHSANDNLSIPMCPSVIKDQSGMTEKLNNTPDFNIGTPDKAQPRTKASTHSTH